MHDLHAMVPDKGPQARDIGTDVQRIFAHKRQGEVRHPRPVQLVHQPPPGRRHQRHTPRLFQEKSDIHRPALHAARFQRRQNLQHNRACRRR